jgi:hypothetical protein
MIEGEVIANDQTPVTSDEAAGNLKIAEKLQTATTMLHDNQMGSASQADTVCDL